MTTYKIARWIKYGDLRSDFIGGHITDALIFPGSVDEHGNPRNDFMSGVHAGVTGAGEAHGLFSPAPTIADIKAMDKNPSMGFVPGVTQSRIIRRRRAIRNLLNEKKESVPWSEYFGTPANVVLHTLAGAGIGTGIGAYLGSKQPDRHFGGTNVVPGAMIGGLAGAFTGAIGSGLAHGIGALAAGVTPRRTLEQQYDYENKNNWLKHVLIPGTSTYDWYKGLGASQHISDMAEDDINKEIARIRKARGIK